jgi:ABC-type antimicrobial peptide transport system permease subunit
VQPHGAERLDVGVGGDVFLLSIACVLTPHDIVSLVSTSRDSSFEHFSFREYQDIRDKTKSYDGVVANTIVLSVGFIPHPGETPRVRGGLIVAGNYFRVLGVEPQLGRGFRDDEDAVPGRDAVVVLGPGFWKSEFSSDPSIIGRTIRLNGKDFTVIGVAPDSFPGMFIFLRPDFYVPLAMAQSFSTDSQKDFFQDRDDRELIVKARLKTGATRRQAQNELAVLAKNFEQEYPKSNHGRGAKVRTQFEMRTQDNDVNWKFSVIFSILALAVLLVACTNAAGLLLARARSRTREIAVRLAIGAGRFRLIRLLMTESLLLALLGGLGGIVVGFASLKLLSRFHPTSRCRCPFPWIDACFWRALACPF